MLVAVIADTHMTPRGSRRLPPLACRELERADVILHAGDVVTGDLLDELRAFAPVHAVLGNNDDALRGELPEELRLDLGGARVGMVHDSGPRDGRERRLRRRFPDRDLVVFGHSHIPMVFRGLEGQVLLNPGSPTDKRRQPHFTMATVEIDHGRIGRCRIVAVDRGLPAPVAIAILEPEEATAASRTRAGARRAR